MLELGQASMFLGWGRIVMLLNVKYGKPDEAPFDIRKRTIIGFTTDKPKGENDLISFFIKVFEGVAKTPEEKKWHADMKKIYNNVRRIQDVQVIKSIMEIVTPGIMDRFIEKMPNYYTESGIDASEILNTFVQSFRFNINDKELLNRVKAVQINLDNASSHIRTTDYIPVGNIYKLSPNVQERQALEDAKMKLAHSYKEFLDYLRNNYPEINIQ